MALLSRTLLAVVPQPAVVMLLGYYNSLMETILLLRSPANTERLIKCIAQVITEIFCTSD